MKSSSDWVVHIFRRSVENLDFWNFLFSEVFFLQNMIDTTAILYQSIERVLLYKIPLFTYLFILARGANCRYIIGNHDFSDDSDMFSRLSKSYLGPKF